MLINPANFFIMRGGETYYVNHKIDGDFRITSHRHCYGDVVAVLMPDDIVRILPNAETLGDRIRKSGGWYSQISEEAADRFRYVPEAQLKLLQANPEIDPDKWRLIRYWDDRLLSALPDDISNIVKR